MNKAKVEFIDKYISNFGNNMIPREYVEEVFEKMEKLELEFGKDYIDFSDQEEEVFWKSVDIKTLVLGHKVLAIIESYKQFYKEHE